MRLTEEDASELRVLLSCEAVQSASGSARARYYQAPLEAWYTAVETGNCPRPLPRNVKTVEQPCPKSPSGEWGGRRQDRCAPAPRPDGDSGARRTDTRPKVKKGKSIMAVRLLHTGIHPIRLARLRAGGAAEDLQHHHQRRRARRRVWPRSFARTLRLSAPRFTSTPLPFLHTVYDLQGGAGWLGPAEVAGARRPPRHDWGADRGGHLSWSHRL